MEGFRIDLKTSLTNTPKVSESKYQAGLGVIISCRSQTVLKATLSSSKDNYLKTVVPN